MTDWLLPQAPGVRALSHAADDCALSPDGALLALSFADDAGRASVVVVEVATGRELARDEGAPVRALCFLGDDALCVARREGDAVRLRAVALPDGGALGEALLPDFGDVPLRLDHAPAAATLLACPMPGWWNTGPLVRTFRTPTLDPLAAINPRRVAAKESKGRAIGASLSPDGRVLVLYGERDYTHRGRGHGLVLDARGAVLATLGPSLEGGPRDARWIDAATVLTWTRHDGHSRTFGLTLHDVARDLVRYDRARGPSLPAFRTVREVALHPERSSALLVGDTYRGPAGDSLFLAALGGDAPVSVTELPQRAEAAAWTADGGMLVAAPGDSPALRLLHLRDREELTLWHTDDRRAARGVALARAGRVALLSWPEERRAVLVDLP